MVKSRDNPLSTPERYPKGAGAHKKQKEILGNLGFSASRAIKDPQEKTKNREGTAQKRDRRPLCVCSSSDVLVILLLLHFLPKPTIPLIIRIGPLLIVCHQQQKLKATPSTSTILVLHPHPHLNLSFYFWATPRLHIQFDKFQITAHLGSQDPSSGVWNLPRPPKLLRIVCLLSYAEIFWFSGINCPPPFER